MQELFGSRPGKEACFSDNGVSGGSCIVWSASVGWKAVFAGLRIQILRSVVFLPEHPERGLISEAGQEIAVYRIVSISRNGAGTVPGHCSLLVLSPGQYRGMDLRKKGFLFAGKYGTTEQQKPSYH